MNVYEKLQAARIKLQSMDMKKSGHNKFANYHYFELGDFLPEINKLFSELNLCSIVTFGKEMAELKIVNIDKPDESITFTSPMADALLKGCHPIQNLGAVETYSRRYLYVSALEIVEHDALDSAPPLESSVKLESVKKGTLRPALNSLKSKKHTIPEGVTIDPSRQEYVMEVITKAFKWAEEKKFTDAYMELSESELETEEKIFANTFFDSAQRSGIAKAKEEQEAKYAEHPAQQA